MLGTVLMQRLQTLGQNGAGLDSSILCLKGRLAEKRAPKSEPFLYLLTDAKNSNSENT